MNRTDSSTRRARRRGTSAAVIVGLSLATGAGIVLAADEAAAQQERVVRAAEGFTRKAAERAAADASALKEQRTAAIDVVTKTRSAPQPAGIFGDQWIYEADAVLYDDLDGDGYYRYLSVRLDADTYHAGVFVYAVLYLSADGEVWEHYYTTDDFLIGGMVSDDEYFVETELIEGYPPGLYDVLIELYDADFGTFSDEYGPAQNADLGLLPLEDASFDTPPVVVSVSSGHGGGGAMSWLLLPVLLLLARRPRRAGGRGGRVLRRSGSIDSDEERSIVRSP